MIPFGLTALVIVFFILENAASSLALSEIAARPVVALLRDGTRIAIQQPGKPVAEGEAGLGGGTSIYFGYRLLFLLPAGETVTCSIRLRTLGCGKGWTAERTS